MKRRKEALSPATAASNGLLLLAAAAAAAWCHCLGFTALLIPQQRSNAFVLLRLPHLHRPPVGWRSTQQHHRDRHHRYHSILLEPLQSSVTTSHKEEEDSSILRSPVVVVGKIIVDEYGAPPAADDDEDDDDDDTTSRSPTLIVGGGGPQAAMGAALALAALDYLERGSSNKDVPPLPLPPQPVLLVGAVGDLDFGVAEERQLLQTLQGALQFHPQLIRGQGCVTPRIRLWHEGEEQTLQWYAVDDSFGDERGAGKLWGMAPSTADLMGAIERSISKTSSSSSFGNRPILHIICEGGVAAPGKNGDSAPLFDPILRRSISCLGIEPILFPQEEDGKVSQDDAIHCIELLQRILDATTTSEQNIDAEVAVPLIVSPDNAAYQAMAESNRLPLVPSGTSNYGVDSWAVREGPKGSTITPNNDSCNESSFPAATLLQLVNPTGAGNAYSAAYTTLRGCGCDTVSSASIATGVGAVFCEYKHCPPYTHAVVERILQARDEVLEKIAAAAAAANVERDGS